MSTHDTCNAIPLCANYYLFGAYFPATQEGRKNVYPTWHEEPSLLTNKDVTNLRPLAKVPMLNVTDGDSLSFGLPTINLSYVHWVTESPINMGLLRS